MAIRLGPLSALLNTMNNRLILKAYHTGRLRGTSLSSGYYHSPDKKAVFCKNPNSSYGLIVSGTNTFCDLPDNYIHFDMSAALDAIGQISYSL